MFLSCLIFAAISLGNICCDNLDAECTLDYNNASVGDPLQLTISFAGDANLNDLHPPELSKTIDPKTWKIDDKSAKTDTSQNVKRLTYRVRPMREGAYDFPSLSFDYTIREGVTGTVTTASIPVHIKRGAALEIAAAEENAATGHLPPPAIILCLDYSSFNSADKLSEDELFLWRKACLAPSVEAFERFDFPEARLNAAACLLLDGNWAKALKIYRKLEWQIGQTRDIERGILSALSIKYDTPTPELPVWRTILRPVLRFALAGRLLVVAATLLGVFLIFFAAGKIMKIFVAVSIILIAPELHAFDPFAEMERQMKEMDSIFDRSFRRVDTPKVEIKANVKTDNSDLKTGEAFRFIIEIETPKSCSISNLQLNLSRIEALVPLGDCERLTDAAAANTNNVVRRFSIPVRYDAPFDEMVEFTVSGMYEISQQRSSRISFFSTFSRNWSVKTKPVHIVVKPLPEEGKPENFIGAVGKSFILSCRPETHDRVCTNDVVRLLYTLEYDGYLPESKIAGLIGTGKNKVVWREYCRATGETKTPAKTFPYYDVENKQYATAVSDGIKLRYKKDDETVASPVTIGENGKVSGEKAQKRQLYFAPRESSAKIAVSSRSFKVLETYNNWQRIDDGQVTGWLKK